MIIHASSTCTGLFAKTVTNCKKMLADNGPQLM